MRKITSLLMLLCAFVGTAWAQITDLSQLSNDKTYFIQSSRAFLTYNETSNANGLATSTGNGGGSINLDDHNQQFKIEQKDGSYYLFSVGAGKYIKQDGTFADEPAEALTLTDVSAQYPDYPWKLCIGSNGLNSQIEGSGVATGIHINGWTTADPGNCYRILDLDVQHEIVEVKYSITYNNVEKLTQTTEWFTGIAYPEVNVSLPFGVSATKPSGNVNAEEATDGVITKTIALTENLPFAYAEDYASINKWYYIQMHSSPDYGKYLQDVTDYIEWLDKSIDKTARDSYTWAFIGNPFDGFILVNRAAGEGKGVNTTGSGNPTLGDIATATKWEIKPSATNQDEQHFCFKYPNGQYMNAQGGKVAFWESADQGSTMWVEERDFTGAAELKALIEEVEAAGYAAGDAVGYYSQASIDALNTVLTTAKTALNGEMTQEISDQQQTAINNAVAALDMVKPTPGKYYVLRCAYRNRCVYVNANNQLNHIENAEDYKTNSKYVWQFEEAGNGKFKMKSVETQSYVNTIATSQNITLSAEAGEVAIGKGAVAGTITFEVGGLGIHANTDPLVGWTNNAESNHYYVEEVTSFSHALSITTARWASLILGYNAEIPEGVEAYYITEDPEGGYVQLTAVEGNVIPANNAVLVSGAENTYSFKLAMESATALENNKLEGTLINQNITGSAYVLGVIDGEMGLYKAELNQDNGSAFLNNAFKAYLPISEDATETSETLSFSFGETTGISNAIIGENGKTEIFDLSGRRVAKMQKGIYIVNGKKVLVK